MSPTPEEWSKLESSKELHKKSLEMLSEKDSFLGGGLDNIEPQDHVVCDRTDGWARWLYDTNTDTFQMLHLPFYFKYASNQIIKDTVEHCRKVAKGQIPVDAPLPDHVREFRDDPNTKALRSAIKTGQSSLEAWE